MMAIHVEDRGAVRTIIHDRPEARNAMDPDSADALTAACLAFDADPEAKVAVLWGSGGAFCAGMDLKVVASRAAEEGGGRAHHDRLAFPVGSAPAPRGPLGPTRLELSKPIIAAIEGPAVAGGMELAMWCDVRVMAEDAYFGVFCRRWGVALADGGTVRLPRLVGFGRAMEIVLTGRKVAADEALRIGLCEKVVPSGTAHAAAEAMAEEIARFPQGAVRTDRRSLYETYGLSVRDALKVEWANARDAVTRQEAGAGAKRFVDGRGRHGDFAQI
jgi:enoyl-CoA hydratase